MKEFLTALQFLTIIPIKISKMDDNKLARSMIYYPIVGCLLGLILCAITLITSRIGCSSIAEAIIIIISLIILTGGIHLDGLADTADAFLSRTSKEKMLLIMRDSHIGTMGVLSLLSALLLKIAFLSTLSPALKIPAILLMCILSRWSLVFSTYIFPYARKEGKARAFKEKIHFKIYLLATLFTLGAAIEFGRFYGLIAFSAIGLNAYVFGYFFKRHLGGITGDTLGAVSEISEIIVLLCFCLLGRSAL
ncbi:MAG: adenosylcobinamide-GDP ribazoletransferase [Candidatus Omnitrophota bacterium]